MVDAAAPRLIVTPQGPTNWSEGGRPWWSVAADERVPPRERAVGHFILDYAFGWPLPCASERRLMVLREVSAEEVARWNYGPGTIVTDETILLGTQRYGGRSAGVWPTHVLWRGLAANAVVMGLILAVPQLCLRGIHGWIGARRRRRYLKCRWCRYDRSGIGERTPCPECGGLEPVKGRSK